MDLRRLWEESPGALVVGPNPESERREPPFHLELAPWAADIAATLSAKYDDLLDLRVGTVTDSGPMRSAPLEITVTP